MGEINDIGGICLSLFLGIAMITLKLWQLADLALPLLILLFGQVLLMFVYARFVIFNVMGRITMAVISRRVRIWYGSHTERHGKYAGGVRKV